MPQSFIYKINVHSTDTHYLKTLAKYNQKVKIIGVSEDSTEQDPALYEDMMGKNIPELVEKAKNSGVKKIKFECGRANSLFAIFPPINATDSSQYLETSGQERIVDEFFALNSGMNRIGKPAAFEPLSQEEALNLFTSPLFISKLSGAIHLADLNSIVFEGYGYCHVLTYGENTSIRRVEGLSFNVEHGFMFSDHSQQYQTDNKFFDKLEEFFFIWQDRNYQGELFPHSMSVNPMLTLPAPQEPQGGTGVRFFENTREEKSVTVHTASALTAQSTHNKVESTSQVNLEVVSQKNNPPEEKPVTQNSISLPPLEFTTDMSLAARKQKEMSAKIKVVRDILFETIWLEELVKKFPYQKTTSTCFVSFDRYSRDNDRISFIAKLINCIDKTGAVIFKPVTIEYDKTLWQQVDEAIGSINKAKVIVYIRSNSSTSNHLIYEDNAVLENNAKVIPVLLNEQSNDFLPALLREIPYLKLGESDIGLAFSAFFSLLLHKMDILNDNDKVAFDRASADLSRQINSQYSDEDIMMTITTHDKRIENDVINLLGL